MNYLIFCSLLIMVLFEAHGQRKIEVGIKPSELLLYNTELNIAIGNSKTRYGLIIAYRPSTQNSGNINTMGAGIAGAYELNPLNRFYTYYTAGLYLKTYLFPAKNIFLETDIFYRSHGFKKKQAEFRNVEGYQFHGGLRSENINVYGLKILLGKTFFLSGKEARVKPYIEIYAGAGIRHKTSTYETFNGFVNDVYYEYLKENLSELQPSPQLGGRFGIVIGK